MRFYLNESLIFLILKNIDCLDLLYYKNVEVIRSIFKILYYRYGVDFLNSLKDQDEYDSSSLIFITNNISKKKIESIIEKREEEEFDKMVLKNTILRIIFEFKEIIKSLIKLDDKNFQGILCANRMYGFYQNNTFECMNLLSDKEKFLEKFNDENHDKDLNDKVYDIIFEQLINMKLHKNHRRKC